MGIINENSIIDVSSKILVYENEPFAATLEESINEYFTRSTRVLGGKVHVSSMTYCLRKEAIKSHLLATNQAVPLDFIDIFASMNFTRGLTSEYMLTKLMRGEIDPQKDLNFEDKIVAHPDAVTKDNKSIIEMKNSNTYTAITLGDDSLYTYFRQTVYYMVMSGIEVGHVIVIYGLPMHLEWLYSEKGQSVYKTTQLKKNGERPFKVFTLNLSKHSELRDKIKSGMRIQYDVINSQGDYKDENLIKNFPRVDGFDEDPKKAEWKCKNCEVYKKCKEIPPEIEDLNLVDILLNRLIDNNIVNISSGAKKEGEKSIE
jgi:hypothetical protein